MGCYNVRCAATGVPIGYGTNVAIFDLCELIAFDRYSPDGYEVDTFGDQMAIISMPRFGEYNDYGYIENELHDPIWDSINKKLYEVAISLECIPKFKNRPPDMRDLSLKNYRKDHRMFILREAYDYMINYTPTYYCPKMQEKRQNRRQEAISAILKIMSQEKHILGHLAAGDHMRAAYGVSDQDKHFWRKIILSDLELGDLYCNTVGKVRSSAAREQWTVYPSKYSNPEIYESKLKLRSIGTQYLENWVNDLES